MTHASEPEQSGASATAIVKAQMTNIHCSQLPKKTRWKGSFYIKIFLEGQNTFKTSRVKGDSAHSWTDTYFLEAASSSNIEMQIFEHHRFRKDKNVGGFKLPIESLLKEKTTISRELWKADSRGAMRKLPNSAISFTLSMLSQEVDVDQLRASEAISQAGGSLAQMGQAPSTASRAAETAETVTGILDQVDGVKSVSDTWDSLLNKIEVFMKLTDAISEIHPYAKTALFVLSAVPKVIIAQRDRDDSIHHLMETIDDIHSFVLEAEPLKTIESHRTIIDNLSALTVECAYLIRDYAVDENFWKRVANLTLLGVQSKIQEYQDKFKDLKTRLNERVNIANANALEQIDIKLMRCLNKVETTATHLILNDLPYADGASYDPSKACFPGTRKDALDDIHRWINKPDSDDTARLLVLTGIAGFGKSAIAHSIAQHYATVNRLGSVFCFSRADQAGRHPGNILSTISRDISNLDPHWQAALYEVVENDHSLRKTDSTILQLKNFILEPAKALAIVGPVVIIIDALDECANSPARTSLLQLLAQMAAALPPNFRILVTARPDTDIMKNFSGKSPHIQHKSIDRKIKTGTDGATTDDATTDADIATFIESRLAPVADALDKKWGRKEWLRRLVTGSGHLFQWSATACRAILEEEGQSGLDVTELLEDFLKAKSLDDLYRTILRRALNEDDPRVMDRFKRVMGSILAAKEPLSKQSYLELCFHGDDQKLLELILAPLGSLLSGTSDMDTPIHALHTSFFDFLIDKGRSLKYHIDPTQQDRHFTGPCLRIMNSELTFNICKLSSSHTPNAALPDLSGCVTKYISPLLSYACRFLGDHLYRTPYDKKLIADLRELLDEHFLHWLEVLSVLKYVNTATRSLTLIQPWVSTHDRDLAAFVQDAIRFVQSFAPPITHSPPHIYLSALPFAPKQSLVSQKYLPKYLSTLYFKSGRFHHWPAALQTLEGHSWVVSSVAYSPDGKYIVSGSYDNTVRVWDAETGEAMGSPFEGHSDLVWSVAYSPDGKHIVSGSEDKTVRVWDAETGKAVGLPFEGHSTAVYSVAYSPDGKHIVSGSWDETIRVWDAETGKTMGSPFEGHSGPVQSVAYSPDGKHIVSGSYDGTVRVWDAETGKTIGSPFEGHSHIVLSVAYSPDGKHIVSGSEDKTVRVWDAETGEAVGSPFEGHSEAIRSVAYFPDGKRILSGSNDKTVRIWDVNGKWGAAVNESDISSVGFRDDSKLENGWILTAPPSGLLFWVPPWHRLGLGRPSNTVVIAPGAVRLELENFVHGLDWQHCQTPL